MKKILYIDMDGVLVHPTLGSDELSNDIRNKYKGIMYNAPGFFSVLKPMEGAIDSFKYLSEHYDTYILTAAPWDNPTAANDKIEWVKKYLPGYAHKRIIISHNKNLCHGDYIIDDNTRNGVSDFKGEHIHFGSDKFPDWNHVMEYLKDEI
jgi:5'-nucleotidase